ncbi:hypothetical protein GCM10023208_12290 [Erythrobacter westpacificensis]|uniref:17 kDa surface antigen n=1 Tax=Erythrobacter westpacificensis TaxID=1055231 RepID=A0ABP9K5Q7_9SPHN
MTFRPTRLASVAALAAALSMAATPASALDLPSAAVPASVAPQADVLTIGAGEANQWRRYRPYRHRHNRGVDAGDVIAGVAVVGVLAAILSSSNRNRDRDRYDDRRARVRYDDRRDRYDGRGIESAVDMCVDQVEYRDNRVENVDRADRDAGGWNVSGSLENGERWTCFIDNSGEVRSIDYGGVAYSSQAPSANATGQLSDAAYSRARATTRTAADEPYSYDEALVSEVPGAGDPRPAYPGGPLPGEEGYDEDWQVDGDIEDGEWVGDGRYTTAQAPDFEQLAR